MSGAPHLDSPRAAISKPTFGTGTVPWARKRHHANRKKSGGRSISATAAAAAAQQQQHTVSYLLERRNTSSWAQSSILTVKVDEGEPSTSTATTMSFSRRLHRARFGGKGKSETRTNQNTNNRKTAKTWFSKSTQHLDRWRLCSRTTHGVPADTNSSAKAVGAC